MVCKKSANCSLLLCGSLDKKAFSKGEERKRRVRGERVGEEEEEGGEGGGRREKKGKKEERREGGRKEREVRGRGEKEENRQYLAHRS